MFICAQYVRYSEYLSWFYAQLEIAAINIYTSVKHLVISAISYSDVQNWISIEQSPHVSEVYIVIHCFQKHF